MEDAYRMPISEWRTVERLHTNISDRKDEVVNILT